MKKFLTRFIKIVAISIPSILLLLFLIPILFPGTVVEKVKQWANNSLDGEVNFSKVRLTFFDHFPSLTTTLHEVTLKGSAPFKKDTLVAADEISLGINLGSLIFQGKINIDKIFVSDGLINIQVDEKGGANYNVYVSGKKSKANTDTSSTALKLEKIDISNIHFVYNDRSVDMLIDAKGFNYTGNGDLSKEIFDLKSHAKIDSLNFLLSGEPYLINKRVNADLITKINTTSLAFFFEKNKLRINRLPVEFSGKLDFLQNGYDMDFTLNSKKSKLKHLITALPPQYLKWLEKTEVEGTTEIFLKLKGLYIASINKSPDLIFDMNIRDGYINYDKAPMAAEDIYLNLHSKMPSLDTDSLELKIDSVNFNVGRNYFKGRIDIKGLSKPNIIANVNTRMNLEEVDRSLGIELFDVKGKCDADIVVNGTYDLPNGKFPVTKAIININEGYIRTGYYPQPINNIELKANVNNASGTLNGLSVLVSPASFNFENQPFTTTASLRNFDNIIYDIKAKGVIDVAKIYKVFSQQGLALDGYIAANVNLKGSQEDATNGRYDRLNNSGTLDLKNINISSDYFPHPFLIKNGLFKFDREKVLFKDFTAGYAHSDFNLNGYFSNFIGYLFSSSEVLKGDFSINSGLINVNEFMSDNVVSADTTSTATTGVIAVPRVYDLSLTANAQRILFNDLVIENLKGKVAVDTGALFLENTSFSMIGCNVQMNARYKPYAAQRASFDYGIKANDFDIKRAYDSVKLFRELASSAQYAEGIVSLDYNLKGVLGGNMQPIYPSLEGGGTIYLKDIKVKGYKLFTVISKETGKDSVNNPNLKKVTIKSTIKNNIINIERFKFKVFGFRPRIEGQTSFDGELNLKMRLGLPPLGIIGIPIKVTGTQDDPKIKLGKKTEDLQEQEFNEE